MEVIQDASPGVDGARQEPESRPETQPEPLIQVTFDVDVDKITS